MIEGDISLLSDHILKDWEVYTQRFLMLEQKYSN